MKKIESIDFFYKDGELDVGKEYSVYSFRTEKFFPRVVYKATDVDKLKEQIQMQILCY